MTDYCSRFAATAYVAAHLTGGATVLLLQLAWLQLQLARLRLRKVVLLLLLRQLGQGRPDGLPPGLPHPFCLPETLAKLASLTRWRAGKYPLRMRVLVQYGPESGHYTDWASEE